MWHNMNLCCFFSHFLYARFSRAACWGEESIFLGEIMDRPCFENGECRESQNGAAINEEKWARSGQDFQDFPVWAMGSDIYSKFSEYAENDIHWSFSWRITHVFNVSCSLWSLPKANLSCAEEFEIVLQSWHQLYENVWRTKISATDVNFESFECGLVVWNNFEHVVCSISNLDFNHQPLVFDTAAFKVNIFWKLGFFSH
jgi:hypothetical protein